MKTSQRQKELLLYRLGDFLTAFLAWFLFYLFRMNAEKGSIDWDVVLSDQNLFYGLIFVPLGWIIIYMVFDKYKDIYRFSRLATLGRTFALTLTGCLVLFFALLLDDQVSSYKTYFSSFITLFLLHFILTSTVRMILLTMANRKLKSGKVSYNTLIIGGDQNALELYREITTRPYSLGHKFVGFIDSNGNSTNLLEAELPKLGQIMDIEAIIEQERIEEVIVAIETSEHNKIRSILNVLFEYGDQMLVKIIPDMYDILLGTVKMNHVYGAVLFEIEQELLPKWQRIIKRLSDIVISIICLIILLPLCIYVMIRVRLSSKGPIFFKQERIGLNAKVFHIYKFRSMVVDAEKDGPQLSSELDDRCTSWGKIMRKWRLDELPQFWNVLKGDMAIVGPRPERKFYIDQIMSRAPYYKQLLKVRPGITSWGQVKYGYASDVDQMLQRLKFDILYIENMSLSLDVKILFYTILVILKGKGK